VLNLADRKLFAHPMLQAWQSILGLSQEGNDRAVEGGYKALED
jgi:predicted nucleotide-binding protein (sugar kinase/HSP70/actin superfamily)